MARSIANLTLSLGLVTAPVKLYPARENRKVEFKLAADDGTPVEQVYRRVDNQAIVGSSDECARAFEGRLIDRDSIAKINEEGKVEDGVALNKVLAIRKFVPLSKIPFEWVTGSYNIIHDPKFGSPLALATIIKAMEKKKVAAVCKYTPRSSQCIAFIYASDGRLKMVTAHFADEVAALPEEAKATDDIKPSTEFVKVATQLIDATMDANANVLSELSDNSRAAKMKLVEDAMAGKPIVATEAKAPDTAAPDLLAALQASLNEKIQENKAA